MSEPIKQIDELTPIEYHNELYYKRDDLYQPFENIPLSGGKVRQCLCLLKSNYNYIKNHCNSNVVTGTGITSPQGIIVSRCAKEFGFNSSIVLGKTSPKSIVKHKLMLNSLYLNAKIDYGSIQAFDNNLNAYIHKYYSKDFYIKFGINLVNNPDDILLSIGNQCENLPDDLDYLIIPCGSGITACGILMGLEKFQKFPKHIIGIQIAGYDRMKLIKSICGNLEVFKHFELRIANDFKYYRNLKLFADNIELDWLYESKAYYYMNNYMKGEIQGHKTLFWIVGNSTPVRNSVYKDGNIINTNDINLNDFSEQFINKRELYDNIKKQHTIFDEVIDEQKVRII